MPSRRSSEYFFLAILVSSFLQVVWGQFTENRTIGVPFTGIAVSGPFTVNIVVVGGIDNAIKIDSTNREVPGNIETVVEGNTLKIRWMTWNFPSTGIVQIQVTAKSLVTLIGAGNSLINLLSPLEGKGLRIMVSGSSSLTGTFKSDTLSAVVSQSASLIATLTVDNLNAVLSDSGAMTISGTAENANLVLSGSGVFHGENLVAQSISTTVSGSGRAEVNGVKELKAVVTDLGVVRYSGRAKLVSEIHDLGSVEKM
jgi:hypothetical protein